MVNNGINEKININSTYCVGLHVLPVFLCCRLRLPCWFAHIWRTWPNLRFMPLWLEDLLQLQEVSWGHSSHLGWAQTVIAPHSINLCTGPYFLQKRCKFIYLYKNYKDFFVTIQQIRKEKTKLCLLFIYLFLNEIIDISTKEDTNWGVSYLQRALWRGIQCAIVTVMEELTRQKKYILFQQQLSLATDKVALPENIIHCSTTE